MAGSYQHYLQQMLQTGFRALESGKRYPSVWVFMREGEPFKRRIEKFGGEHEFYSATSDGLCSTLDDKITRWEALRQSDVRKWRELPNGACVPSEDAAQLVGLTGMRTKAVRQTIRSIMQQYIPCIAKLLQNPNITSVRIDETKSIDELLVSAIAEDIERHREETNEEISPAQFAALVRMAKYSTLEVLGQQFSKIMADLEQVFSQALDTERFTGSLVHQKLLAEIVDDASAREDLRALKWSIVHNETQSSWILPDCAVLSVDHEGAYKPFFFGDKDTRAAIFLPIAPNRILMGLEKDLSTPDIGDFNKAAASCSQEFFISAADSHGARSLVKLIGSVGYDETEKGLQKTIAGLDPLSEPKERSLHPIRDSFSMEAIGLSLDKADLCAICEKLGGILFELGREFDLSRLFKVVLCTNVSEQISALDEGSFVEYSETDARNIISWKCTGEDRTFSYTLFVNINAVDALFDEASEAHDYVRNFLIQNIANIHHRTVLASIGSSIPDFLEAYTDENLGPQPRDAAMRSGIIFMDTFLGCRIAGVDHAYVKGLIQSFNAALSTFSKVELPTNGRDAQISANAESLWDAAVEVMFAASRLLSACRSVGTKYLQFIETDCELKSLVDCLGLKEWLAQLDFDLERMRVGFRAPMQSEPIITLQRHLERLIWAHGAVLVVEDGEDRMFFFTDRTFTYSKLTSRIQERLDAAMPSDFPKQLESLLVQIE